VTRKQLSAITKRLSAYYPELRSKGPLLFVQPVGQVLRGIDLHRSGDPVGFYVTVFFQPLCVPATSIYLNLGWRLGGGVHRWRAESPSLISDLRKRLEDEALPFLEVIRSPRDAAIAGKALNQSLDGATQQAIAYSFARAGDVPEAIQALDDFVALGQHDDRDWVRAEGEEALALRATLLSDPSRAQSQLAMWEDRTAEALGLTAFR
jgi:hypothetical protein